MTTFLQSSCLRGTGPPALFLSSLCTMQVCGRRGGPTSCGRIQAWWAKGCHVCGPAPPSEPRRPRQPLGQGDQWLSVTLSPGLALSWTTSFFIPVCGLRKERKRSKAHILRRAGQLGALRPHAPSRLPLLRPSRRLRRSLPCFLNLPAALPPRAPPGLCLRWSHCLEGPSSDC